MKIFFFELAVHCRRRDPAGGTRLFIVQLQEKSILDLKENRLKQICLRQRRFTGVTDQTGNERLE